MLRPGQTHPNRPKIPANVPKKEKKKGKKRKGKKQDEEPTE